MNHDTQPTLPYAAACPGGAPGAPRLSGLSTVVEAPGPPPDWSPPVGPPPLQAGQVVGNYRVVAPLSEGGMGSIFEAQHLHIARRVAIKVLRPEHALDPRMIGRFLREAQAVNEISHPGIISAFDFGLLPPQQAYIILEYLEGDNLRQLLTRGAVGMGIRALRLMRQVASALEAAHRCGIVHRDLKPENVMIVSDPDLAGGERAKLLDFGLAKATTPDGRVSDQPQTGQGLALGTPWYMAPEQFVDASSVDEKADLYSMGVMFFEILTGMKPFTAHQLRDMVLRHTRVRPHPLRGLIPAVPAALEELLQRMLACDPAGRPAVGEVAAVLDRLLDGLLDPLAAVSGPVAPLARLAEPAPADRLPSPCCRLLVLVLLVAVVLLSLRGGTGDGISKATLHVGRRERCER